MLSKYAISRVVAGNNVVHACRNRRLKCTPSVRGYSWTTRSPGDINTGDLIHKSVMKREADSLTL